MIEILRLDHLGRGIGYIDKKVTFIPNTLPGEIVDIIITKEKKNYNEGVVKKYLKTSANRIKPICPYYEQCGGCDLMHMSYDIQAKFKQNKIENIMHSLNSRINDIVKCDNIYFYRNKVTFQVNKKLGLYKKNSNDIIEINQCFLISKKINQAINELKKLNLHIINQIICKCMNEKLMIIIESNNMIKISDNLKQLADSIIQKTGNKYKLLYGNEQLSSFIGLKEFQISSDSFFQVNPNITEKLYNKIKKYCKDLKSKNILDLYCGTGTIGIYINNKDLKVLGVELNKFAIIDAKKNALLNKCNNISFVCGDVEKEIKKINFNPDTIIVDPPRSGLSKESIKAILNINAQNIIYVSCDPFTLFRDLNILKINYNIIEITPFDMFPNTHHVECLTLLCLKQEKN